MTGSMIATMESIALDAGKIILGAFRNGCAVEQKGDGSPVTDADEHAEEFINNALRKTFPSIPIVAEEATSNGRLASFEYGDEFFLVDPLDGTREFINGRPEFTVNIALVSKGFPVLGVVVAPALEVAFSANGYTAERIACRGDLTSRSRTTISTRPGGESLVAVVSRSHSCDLTKQFLTDHAISSCTDIGSSLKFCLLAEGKADIYPRFGRTMEWDTAAGDAVLRSAGGTTHTLDGQILRYGKVRQANDTDFANPGFIGRGCQTGERHKGR
jgi:3'(2'), 5'-bisphosphate nucleotidase